MLCADVFKSSPFESCRFSAAFDGSEPNRGDSSMLSCCSQKSTIKRVLAFFAAQSPFAELLPPIALFKYSRLLRIACEPPTTVQRMPRLAHAADRRKSTELRCRRRELHVDAVFFPCVFQISVFIKYVKEEEGGRDIKFSCGEIHDNHISSHFHFDNKY